MQGDRNEWGWVAAIGSVIVMILITAGECGCAIGLHYERQKAIEAGVGRWVVDGATGGTEFRYGVGN